MCSNIGESVRLEAYDAIILTYLFMARLREISQSGITVLRSKRSVIDDSQNCTVIIIIRNISLKSLSRNSIQLYKNYPKITEIVFEVKDV